MHRYVGAFLVLTGFLAAAVQAPPHDAAAQVNVAMARARVAIEAQKHAEAIGHLREALRLLPAVPGSEALATDIHYNMIVCYEKTGDVNAAVAAAQRRLDAAPNDAAVLELSGKLHFARGSYDKAAQAFARLRALHPPTPTLLRQIARVAMKRHDQDAALATVAELLAADTGDASIETALEAYILFFQYEKALGVIDTLRARRGDLPMYRYAAGLAHANLRQDAEAARLLASVTDDPLYGVDARFELGLVLARRPGAAQDAIAMFAELLERDPYFTQAYLQLSTLVMRKGLRQEAAKLRECFEALERTEQDFRRQRGFAAAGLAVDAAVHAAAGYERTRQYRKAEEVLRAELVRHPGELRLTLALAGLLSRTHRHAQVERLLIGGPVTAESAWLVGRALTAQGKQAAALAHLTALTERPELEAGAHVQLAQFHLDTVEDPARARAHAEAALRLRPSAPHPRLVHARALFALGRHGECREATRELAEQAWDGQALARLVHARSVLQSGDAAQAATILDGVRGPLRGSAGYFAAKAAIMAALEDPKAEAYAAWRDTMQALDARAQELERDVAIMDWPHASELHRALAANAAKRRQPIAQGHHAFLAVEADPDCPAARRLLLELPLADFVKLSHLAALARLAPGDTDVARRIAEIRAAYGLDAPP